MALLATWYVYSLGIRFRNIKRSNVLITQSPTFRSLDISHIAMWRAELNAGMDKPNSRLLISHIREIADIPQGANGYDSCHEKSIKKVDRLFVRL